MPADQCDDTRAGNHTLSIDAVHLRGMVLMTERDVTILV